MNYKNTIDFALDLDAKDKLKKYRKEFHIPLQKNGEECVYMCGNSLGLQPIKTRKYLINIWLKNNYKKEKQFESSTIDGEVIEQKEKKDDEL